MDDEIGLGDAVRKYPETWILSEFDSWGAGVGIGQVVAPPWDHVNGVFGHDDDGGPSVDVVWPRGRCFQKVSELIRVI